jgi:HAD superfamily hydrolase (TIGR01509 family)
LPRLERFELAGYFERVLVSDKIAATKPEPAAYRPVIEHVRQPASALFVDDQVGNVHAAEKLGIRAVLASDENAWVSTIDNALDLLAEN